MHKTFGLRWLRECFCHALAFVSADSDEARNPQRFIHVSVIGHFKRPPCKQNDSNKKDNRFYSFRAD